MTPKRVVPRRVREALEEIGEHAKRHGGMAQELQVRSHATAILREAVRVAGKGRCRLEEETAASGSTTTKRPDWRAVDVASEAVHFYADHKALRSPDPAFAWGPYSAQAKDYLLLSPGGRVLMTDAVDFVVLEMRGPRSSLREVRRARLADRPLAKRWWDFVGSDAWDSVVDLVRSLLAPMATRAWRAEELGRVLGRRAALLADQVREVLGGTTTSVPGSLTSRLRRCQDVLRDWYDPSMVDDTWMAEFSAQVLILGSLHAWARAQNGFPDEKRSEIDRFWASALSASGSSPASDPALAPFGIVRAAISGHERHLSLFRDTISLLVSAAPLPPGPIDPNVVLEAFSGAFSSRLQYEKGQFYTPREVAAWITACVDSLLRSRFGATGIADGGRIQRVVDPCLGTGTFLEEAIALASTGPGDPPPELVGLEVLPAPLAVARLRLDEAAERHRFPQAKVSVHLVDTPSDALSSPPAPPSRPPEAVALARVIQDAGAKAKPPIMVVLGNPPSSQKPGEIAPRGAIERLMGEMLPPEEMRKGGRQNVAKAVRNEAYRFLRWGAERVLEKGGILAFVMPGALVDRPSTVGMRSWLLAHFSELFVLEVDPDVRSRAATGALFGVKQGRCVLVAIAPPPDRGRGDTVVRHASIMGMDLDSRREWLEGGIRSGIEAQIREAFVLVHPAPPSLSFSGLAPPPVEWQCCWPLWATEEHEGVFVGHGGAPRSGAAVSGAKLAPTDLVFHSDRSMLEQRSRAIGATTRSPTRDGGVVPSSSAEDLVAEWFGPSGGRKRIKADRLGRVRWWFLDPKNLNRISELPRRYCYRPFTWGWILRDPGLFDAMKKDASRNKGTRVRPELLAAFDNGAIGMTIAPTPEDIGRVGEGAIAAFAWILPDNDLVRRGNARVLTDVIARRNKAGWDILLNVHHQLLDLAGRRTERESCRRVLFYAYAVLSSSRYLETFEDMVEAAGDPRSPLRLPIPKDARLFRSVAELGAGLAVLENVDRRLSGSRTVRPEWLLRGRSAVPLGRWRYEKGILALVTEDGTTFARIEVDDQTFSTRMGGHSVVDSWLELRRRPSLNRDFGRGDLSGLADLLERLRRRNELIGRIDEWVAKVMKADLLSPPCRVPTA